MAGEDSASKVKQATDEAARKLAERLAEQKAREEAEREARQAAEQKALPTSETQWERDLKAFRDKADRSKKDD